MVSTPFGFFVSQSSQKFSEGLSLFASRLNPSRLFCLVAKHSSDSDKSEEISSSGYFFASPPTWNRTMIYRLKGGCSTTELWAEIKYLQNITEKRKKSKIKGCHCVAAFWCCFVQLDRLAFLAASQLLKSLPRMKNLRPIWTIGIWSSSIMRRKWRTEKPAISEAVGMSRNVLALGLSAPID